MEVQVKGPVSAIESAFHVNLLTFGIPARIVPSTRRIANPPYDLPFQLWHISGLDNYLHPASDVREEERLRPGARHRAGEAVVRHATTGSGPSAPSWAAICARPTTAARP